MTMIGQLVLAAPTTNPSERGAVLQREREHYLQIIESLPRLDAHRMTDILQMGVEDGQILFRSPAHPWPNFEARRIEIDGSRFPASLTYSQFVSNEPNSRQFELKFEDYPDGDLFGQLRLQWRALAGTKSGELSIEKSEQTSSSFYRVFYFQNPGMARLLVFANDASADHNLQSFNYLEPDFATLRQRHPAEVQDWLRPVLHRLQQDAVFAPELNAAWQVLASQWPVPPQVTQEVGRLVPELDNAQSRVRNHAANQLADLGRDGATAILRLDRTGLSLQQNVRLDEVVARFRRMPRATAYRLEGNVDFLLDAEYCDDATVRSLAAQKLETILGHPLSLDVNSIGPARLDAIEAIRLGLHPSPKALPPDSR
jgi:hypothetical protein